jgi:hypothetical protein
VKRILFACALALTLAVVAGCKSGSTKIDTPTTPSNAGGAALVAYGAAGTVAKQYFKLPLCTNPITALCKTQAINDSLNDLDRKAHDAAIAADAAVNDAAKQQAAADALKVEKGVTESTAVQSQIRNGGAP